MDSNLAKYSRTRESLASIIDGDLKEWSELQIIHESRITHLRDQLMLVRLNFTPNRARIPWRVYLIMSPSVNEVSKEGRGGFSFELVKECREKFQCFQRIWKEVQEDVHIFLVSATRREIFDFTALKLIYFVVQFIFTRKKKKKKSTYSMSNENRGNDI